MHRFLTYFFGFRLTRTRRTGLRPAPRRVRPGLEILEDRALLSGGIALANNVVHIQGTTSADRAEVRLDDQGTLDAADDRVIVQLAHQGHTHRAAFAVRRVSRIVFTGGQGNDRFQDFTPLPSVARGGKGADTLLGGPEDVLIGGGGNNLVLPLPGSTPLSGEGHMAAAHDDKACQCEAKIEDVNFAGRSGINGQGRFFAEYMVDAKTECVGEGCEKKVSYQWSIKAIKGSPVIDGSSTGEGVTVKGLGEFELTVVVTVQCRKKLSDRIWKVEAECSDTKTVKFVHE